jgi:hypothetical protein
MACFESSPGRMRRTDVWISRDEMVDFLLYDASFDASVAAARRRAGQPHGREGRQSERERTDALENVVDERVEDEHGLVRDTGVGVDLLEDLVDVRRAARVPPRVSTALRQD